MNIVNREVRKQILITKDTDANLKALSEVKGVSQNEIINKALEAYLKRYGK